MIQTLLILLCFNSYVSTWRVTVCSETGFQGICGNLQANGCMNTGQFEDDTFMEDRIQSINIHGICVRAYSDKLCFGTSKAFYPGSEINKIMEQFGYVVSSFGPCLPNECAEYDGDKVKNCIFHDEIFIGVGFDRNYQVVAEKNDPIRFYQLGYKDRVEYVKAIIKTNHLDNGSPITNEVENFALSMGMETDQAGYIIPKILGGWGNITYNVFPINKNVNEGQIYEKIDDMVYGLVKRYGWLEMVVNLQYQNTGSTRPYVIIYRFHNDNVFRMRDLINP